MKACPHASRFGQIAWSLVPRAEGWEEVAEDVGVWIDVAKLDASWRKDVEHYVGPNGAGSKQGDRYKYVGELIKKNRLVYMAYVALDENRVITFGDGRHRFAWLRDHDVKALPAAISPSDAAEIETRFGSPLRVSIYRY